MPSEALLKVITVLSRLPSIRTYLPGVSAAGDSLGGGFWPLSEVNIEVRTIKAKINFLIIVKVGSDETEIR